MEEYLEVTEAQLIRKNTIILTLNTLVQLYSSLWRNSREENDELEEMLIARSVEDITLAFFPQRGYVFRIP